MTTSRVPGRWLREKELMMAVACPGCGNARNFLVKTLQMHVIQVEEDGRVDVAEESRPAVFEMLCDECETAIPLDELDENVRREILLMLGAR